MASSRSGFAEDSDLEEVQDVRDKKPSATIKVCWSPTNIVIGHFVKYELEHTLYTFIYAYIVADIVAYYVYNICLVLLRRIFR